MERNKNKDRTERSEGKAFSLSAVPMEVRRIAQLWRQYSHHLSANS
jgi:hypothetical protein